MPSLLRRSFRRPLRRSALAVAAAAALGPMAVAPAAAATCTWNAASGNWNALLDWANCVAGNGNPFGSPGSSDTANIGAAGVVTINTQQSVLNLNNAGQINIDAFGLNLVGGGSTTNSGVINVGSAVTANLGIGAGNNLDNAGGIINVGNGSVINQFGSTISGGTINTTGTGALVAGNNGGNFLSGVTFNGALDLASGTGIERIINGMTLGGTINVNSNSILAFQGDQTINGTGTITLGGSGGSNRINTEAGNLTLASGITINGQNGTIGGQSFVGGPATLTNDGTISASVAGGQINLSIAGGGLTTNNGVLSALNGGNLLLSTAVTNAGTGHIDVIGAGSVVTQSGIAITGGTVNTSGGGTLVATNNGANRLAGVTLNGTLDLATNTGLELATGNLTFGASGGKVNINSNSVFGLQADTLSGNGTITFGSTGSSNRLSIDAGDTVIGAGVLVHGQNGTIGGQTFVGGAATLTNNGTISADVAGGTITLNVNGAVTNNGTLSALNGGTLVLNNSVNGTAGSSIIVGAGSTLLQNGVTLNGVINSSGTGNFLVSNNGANTLDGVTFSGNLNLANATSLERALNGLTLTAGSTISINNNSVFALQGETLGGSGTVTFGDTGGSNRLNIEIGNSVIGAGILVHGQNGTIGNQTYAGGTATLTNNGTISADVAGGTITIGINSSAANAVTNNGVLSAANGGTLVLNSNVTGNAGSFITVGAGSTIVQNGVTLTGVVNNSGTGEFSVSNSGANFLNGVTFTGPLDLSTATSVERAINGLTFGAGSTVSINNNSLLAFQNEEIAGTATITFGSTGASNRVNIEAGATVLDSGITIQGQNGTIGNQSFAGGAATLANAGAILANVDQGTITLNVSGLTTNTGTLAALNGGTLALNSAVTNAGGGHIDALGGGTAGSVVQQNGITITGGTLNTSGAGRFVASNNGANFLSSVTLAGTLDLASNTGIERIAGGSLVLNGGVININSNSVLSLQSDTVSGTGTITLGSTGASNRLSIEIGDSVIGAGVLVHGQNGTIGGQVFAGGAATLTNNGVITADTGGGQMVLNVSGLTTNNNTLSAQNGSSLLLNSAVTNSVGGHIDAIGANSVVSQNGVTITGGTLNTSGGGTFVVSNSGNNFLANTTLAGTLDLASASSLERLLNTTVTLGAGGVININSNSLLSLQASTVDGTGTINLGSTGSSNRINIEAGGSTIGAGVTIQGQNGTIGGQTFAGGAATLTNNGTISASVAGGTIGLTNASFVNNGTFSATAGVLSANTGFTGTGTVLTSGAGQVIVGAASTTGNLLNNGSSAGALVLGANNLTVSSDYNNANFGTGNAFNKLAHVSTTGGQILAGGNAAQAITGANVTGGNTANATLTINNVRVGANTFNYQIEDAGNTGPTLRGAIQTTANGANLSDARLSGAGVTAGNYSTGAPGSNSGNLGVTFTAAAAGALAPLNGQVLNLTSNFANIADQKLNIVLGNGAAAYNAAVGSATTPVQIANQRIGGSNSATVTVANTAAAGLYSEDLNVSVAGSSGASGAGSISGRLAGTNNTGAGAITVGGLDTTSSGAKSGTVTLAYQTAGAVGGVSNGLGTASAGTQVVTVSGNVYQAASGAIVSAPLNFGNVQTGTAVSQNLVIKNTAVGANGYVEDLNASFATGVGNGQGGNLITGSGSLAGIVAGASSGNTGSGPMTVTVNTGAAGVVNGSIAVNYYTAGAVNGVSNGLGTALVGSDNYGVTGNIQAVANVIDQAKPVVNGVAGPQPVAVDLGSVRINTAANTTLNVTNQATGNQQAYLNASIASNGGPVTASGSFAGLAPGASIPGTSGIGTPLQVGVDTTAAGLRSGSATISAVSDITSYGNCGANCTLNLANQTVNVSAKVYQVAQPTIAAVDLGATRVGGSLSGAVSVSNTQDATAVGFQEGLNAAVKSSSGLSTAGGTITNLAAGNTDAASITVGLGAATAGQKSGTVTLGLQSNGAGTSGLATLNLADSAAIAVTGKVYQTAVLSVVPPSPTIDFGIVRVGTAVNAQTITISNVAQVTPGYNDTLKSSVSGLSGPMSAAANNLAALVAGGASGSAAVSLNTALGNAGVYSEIAHVSSLSQDGVLADVSGGSADVTVKAQINNLANAVLSLAGGAGALSGGGSHYTLDLGNIFQGTNLASSLTLTNQVAGPADELTGSFDLSGLGGFVASGWNAADLVAGASETGLGLLYDALNLGAFASTITFNANSYNTSQGAYALGPVTISIIGDVIQQGVGNVPEPGTLALLVAAAAAGWATRRRSVAARRAA